MAKLLNHTQVRLFLCSIEASRDNEQSFNAYDFTGITDFSQKSLRNAIFANASSEPFLLLSILIVQMVVP